MFFGEEGSPFGDLPPEMMVEVLGFLNLDGKKESRLVCKRWRWILDHPDSGLLCFTQGPKKTTKDTIKCLLKYQLHMEELQVGDFKMTWAMMMYYRNKFPPIRRISLKSGNSERSVITILKYGCAQTECLTLGQSCFSQVQPGMLSLMLSGIKWCHLTELSLEVMSNMTETIITSGRWKKTFLESHKNHAAGIERIFKNSTVPNIKNLRLDVKTYEGNEISTGFIKMMSEYMNFIDRHRKTLKDLALEICLFSNVGEMLPNIPNIPAPFFSAEQQETAAESLKLVSLKIKASHFDILAHLVPPCFWESNKLTKFSWTPIRDQNWSTTSRLMVGPGTLQPFESLIERSRNTLTDVTVTFIHGQINVDPVQISWFESCPSLRELTIDNLDKFLHVQVRLPQVRKLDIRNNYFNSEDLSSWIARTFQNLEIVQVSVVKMSRQNLQMDWVQNLLLLRKLQEIWFRCLRSYSDVVAWIRQFCEDKPRMMLKVPERKRQDKKDCYESCLIKILPIRKTEMNVTKS